jgi:hypothetical protein
MKCPLRKTGRMDVFETSELVIRSSRTMPYPDFCPDCLSIASRRSPAAGAQAVDSWATLRNLQQGMCKFVVIELSSGRRLFEWFTASATGEAVYRFVQSHRERDPAIPEAARDRFYLCSFRPPETWTTFKRADSLDKLYKDTNRINFVCKEEGT